VAEDTVAGYNAPSISINKSTVDGEFYYEVTNSHHEETQVSVKKIWEDDGGRDGLRPAEVTIKLLADGVDTGKTVTLNEANNWQDGWTGLAKNAGGTAIEYTVAEDTVAGYNAPSISINKSTVDGVGIWPEGMMVSTICRRLFRRMIHVREIWKTSTSILIS
jgi:hypothetical protein